MGWAWDVDIGGGHGIPLGTKAREERPARALWTRDAKVKLHNIDHEDRKVVMKMYVLV